MQPEEAVVDQTQPEGQDRAAPQLAVELLERLTEQGVPQLAAFRSRVGLVAQLTGKSPEAVTIDDLCEIKPRLRQALANRKYSENTIQAYTFEVTRLLRYAEEMGWSYQFLVPDAWKPLLDAAKKKRCVNICRNILKFRMRPDLVTQDDLDGYVRERVQTRAWEYNQNEANRFIKLLAEFGAWTKLDARRQKDFGVRLEELPTGMREEIRTLLDWKTAHVAQGRKRRQKIRKITARNVSSTFGCIYGYARDVYHANPQTLRELISPELMYPFVSWYIEERGVSGRSAHVRLVSVLALFRQHPRYADYDVSWLKELIDGITVDSETERQERRAAKQVPYAQIQAIPEAIRKTRKQVARKGPKKFAWIVQTELMLLWLTVLPWRQRNLRECRIGGPHPNLFKRSLQNTPAVAKPDWVHQILKEDPNAEFWQFRFAPDGETKNGRGIHALVPRPLVPLLEEYLSQHRPALLGSRATQTLFLNTAGGQLTPSRIARVVAEQTLRHIGKRITPHTFRHIVAYAYLETNAKDYLTLSKILWHKNVTVTINIYGSTFNESNGVCAMERWVEARADK